MVVKLKIVLVGYAKEAGQDYSLGIDESKKSW